MASIKLKGDTSGEVTIQAPAVAGTTILNLPATSSTLATQNALGVRNLIINGDMRIDQRNAGSAVTLSGTPNSGYSVDRFLVVNVTDATVSFQQSSDVPTGQGFDKSLVSTVTVTDTSLSSGQHSFIRQQIEGNNCYHLQWGTSDAKDITLSFWVKSSVSGTFGGTISNSGRTRSYPFSYTILSTNTWEKKTITIPADTTGTWAVDNTTGLSLSLSLGSSSTQSDVAGSWYSSNLTNATGATNLLATSGATFYITGVQLEISDGEATPFEHRPYDMELARCQRYYETSYNQGTALGTVTQDGAEMWLANRNPGLPHNYLKFRVIKRINPAITIYNSGTGATGSFSNLDTATSPPAVTSRIGHKGSTIYTTTSTNLGQFLQFHYTADAEL